MRSHSLFLIRPATLPGESLSSWRQRSAWLNGYTLFPIFDERLRRVDPDLGIHDDDLGWIATCHNRSIDDVLPLTLRGHVGKIVDHLASRSQPNWWLRARQGNDARPFGPMFCPACLRSDATPYFRLAWRFGFVTQCLDHGCQLIDQCPCCLHPPWPGTSGIKERRSANCLSLRYCWHCGFDLANVPKTPCKGGATVLLLDGLLHGPIQCGSQSLPVLEVLHALRGICQLFLRRRARQKILLSKSSWVTFVDGMSDDAKSANSVDYLCVADREYLLTGAWSILAGWPDSFLEFARGTGVSRLHFNSTQELQPKWMNQTIDEKLALQNRSVTPEVIAMTINELASENFVRLTKTAIRKRLNWSGERGLDAFFPKRFHATASEHAAFIESALAEIQRTSGFKRSHRHAIIDIGTLALCLHNKLKIENACALSFDVLCSQLAEISAESPMSTLLREVLKGWRLVPRTFHATVRAQPRQVRKRMVRLMARLDENLQRDVSIFY